MTSYSRAARASQLAELACAHAVASTALRAAASRMRTVDAELAGELEQCFRVSASEVLQTLARAAAEWVDDPEDADAQAALSAEAER